MPNPMMNCIVSQRIEITEDLIKLRIIPDDWEMPEFTPGQYSLLGLPGTSERHVIAVDQYPPLKDPDKIIKRAYSVASSSVSRQYVEFYVGLVRSGALSPRLFALKSGNPVSMSEKCKGMFTLSEVPSEFAVVLIATGTGVAPYMSMIRTEIEEGLRHRFAIIHGACHVVDLGYNQELSLLSKVSDKFNYLPILSHSHEEPGTWEGYKGFVQKLWNDRVLEKNWGFRPTPENTHVFLCGNPLMIEAMMEILPGEGFIRHKRKTPGQVHVEAF